jgi:hypothetical protein
MKATAGKLWNTYPRFVVESDAMTCSPKKETGRNAMGALRKQKQQPRSRVGIGFRGAPEAFGYDADVTPEVVKSIQDSANKLLDNEGWVIIDGYVGKK